ncbi:MAG: class I tRNA ligase family protein [Ruthenibacterium lactatiformans]
MLSSGKGCGKFWEDNQIFEKSIDSRRNNRTYTFYDGPPITNGNPYQPCETRAFKDMIPRYHAMKVRWCPVAGWDTHGCLWS